MRKLPLLFILSIFLTTANVHASEPTVVCSFGIEAKFPDGSEDYLRDRERSDAKPAQTQQTLFLENSDAKLTAQFRQEEDGSSSIAMEISFKYSKLKLTVPAHSASDGRPSSSLYVENYAPYTDARKRKGQKSLLAQCFVRATP